MEIPERIVTLYKHWDKHLAFDPQREHSTTLSPELQKELSWFASERLFVWEKKELGLSRPYTDDDVLNKYRFCNIYREFDAQTVAFHTMLKPLEDDFALWLLNMFYCRFIARPETIVKTGLLSFDPEKNKNIFDTLLSLPSPKYGTPYVFPVSTIMRSETPTRELFITKHVPRVIENVADLIESFYDASVSDSVEDILPVFGFNHRFLWTEVLIDVAYQYPEYINLFAPFPVGPGSAPTMKQVNPDTEPHKLVVALAHTDFDIQNIPTIDGKPIPLSAENWEGIGCEFRKYTNLTNDQGRKRIYR